MTLVEIMVCGVVVPGEPVPKARARVVDGHAFTPKRTAQAEARFRQFLATAERSSLTRWPESEPLRVEAVFHTASRRRCDLDNLGKLVLDSGNGVIWRDDSQIDTLRLERRRGAAEPRTELRVYRWADL